MSFILTPASGSYFVNREGLISDMIQTLKDKKSTIGFALYGKRRVGKTSVLMETKRILQNKREIVPVYFSLWELVEETIEEFIKTLSAAIVDSYQERLPVKYKLANIIKAPLGTIKEIIREIKISLKLQDEVEVLLTFKERDKESIAVMVDKVFDLAENLAAETKTKCVLIIDEFPSIMELKNGKKYGLGIIKKIRTIMETQKNTALCISGSIRKTMRAVVLKPASPFYRQFVVKEVLPLEEKYVKSLLRKNIRIEEEAINKIYKFTRGIPFYVQFLGRELLKYKGVEIEAKMIPEVINEFLTQEGSLLFTEEFDDLNPRERSLLLSMAGRESSSPSQIAKDTGDDIGVVSVYLGYLENKQVIKKEDRGIYTFEDPIFQEWVKRKTTPNLP